MDREKREELKQKLSPINKELRKHGGNNNRIKISQLKDDQLIFLYELLNSHLENYRELAKKDLENFFEEEFKNNPYFKILAEVGSIQIPEKQNDKWELEICRSVFGTEVVVFEIKEWEVLDKGLVG